MKIIIGVIVEGDGNDVIKFAYSYWNNVEESEHEILPVCIDINVEKKANYEICRKLMERLKFEYLKVGSFISFYQAAESLVAYSAKINADLCFVFHETHLMVLPGTIQRAVVFFEKNPDVQVCTFPIFHDPGFNDSDQVWNGTPKPVLSIHGKPVVIKVSDNFSFSKINHDIYSLPWPPIRSTIPPSYEEACEIVNNPTELTWLDKLGAMKTALV